ncbi:hypothetical protein ACFTXM_42150 [Streptomyces sp. NPDC056930]|uniref:hypothetical protein n=1 Tax=Streptomyces sp. NPDC056930 TaxID=3345967 RepID=UPI00362CD960
MTAWGERRGNEREVRGGVDTPLRRSEEELRYRQKGVKLEELNGHQPLQMIF